MSNSMPKGALSRRTLLRSAAAGSAALGLPLLDVMLNRHGSALANGQELPVRLGIYYIGNGVDGAEPWVPAQTGANWSVPEDGGLRPLIDRQLQGDVSVVTGASFPDGQAAHKVTPGSVLAGIRPSGGKVQGPTVDQIVAKRRNIGQPIVAAVNYKASANANLMEKTLSWVDKNTPFGVPETDPAALFSGLFGNVAPAGNDDSMTRVRASVLDRVSSEITSLKPKVSVADRARLERHFEAIREVEQLMSRDFSGDCSAAAAPDYSFEVAARTDEAMTARHRAMVEITALALVCDIAPSFILAFSIPGDQTPLPSQTNSPNIGAHSLNHRGFSGANPSPSAADTADVRANVQYQVSAFGDLIDNFKSHVDATGTSLLESSTILATSEVFRGVNHSHAQQVLLLAGTARGKLVMGNHIKTNSLPTKVLLSMLRATLGDEIEEFGSSKYRVTDGLAELEA